MAESEGNPLESQPSPLNAVRGRYRQPPLSRWPITIFAVIWLPLGVGQLLKGQWPLGLVLGSVLGLAAIWAWRVPAARSDEDGVRLRNKTVSPWAQIVDVERPVDDGWKLPPAELVLDDGKRRPLQMLSRAPSAKLRGHVLGQQAPPGPNSLGTPSSPSSQSGLEGEHER